LYKCNAVASAIHYSLPSRLIRFPFLHTCIPFTSPRFLCITHSARHVRDVTPTRAASRIERSSGGDWLRQPSSAHQQALAPDKIRRKGGKVEILWVHTYRTTSSRPRGRRVQSLVQIGSEMWICVSSYKQTNKHSTLYIRYPEYLNQCPLSDKSFFFCYKAFTVLYAITI